MNFRNQMTQHLENGQGKRGGGGGDSNINDVNGSNVNCKFCCEFPYL